MTTIDELRVEADLLVADLEKLLEAARADYERVAELDTRARNETLQRELAQSWIDRMQEGARAAHSFERVRAARRELNRPRRRPLMRRRRLTAAELQREGTFTGLSIEQERDAGLFDNAPSAA